MRRIDATRASSTTTDSGCCSCCWRLSRFRCTNGWRSVLAGFVVLRRIRNPRLISLLRAEEISTFFPGSTLWQAFVCAIVAAVTLQCVLSIATFYETDRPQVHRPLQHGQARPLPGHDYEPSLARLRAYSLALPRRVRRSLGRMVHPHERGMGTPPPSVRDAQLARNRGRRPRPFDGSYQLPHAPPPDPDLRPRREPLPGLQCDRSTRSLRVRLLPSSPFRI